MTERDACAVLKQRFEAAGLRIEENLPFEDGDIRFEIDGFDAAKRVGYEYVTEEAGDSWDVDGEVVAALAARREQGDLHVLVVSEAEAPDRATVERRAEAFLAALRKEGVLARPRSPRKSAVKKPRATKRTRSPARS